MLYSTLKKILFKLNPETAHHVSLKSLRYAHALGLTRIFPMILAPRTVMGLQFPNPIGLAAGLDKNGDYSAALAALGFGFIEIGTITPKPQAGNPLPRLFRLVEQEALINRLGFNNKGLDYAVEKLSQSKYKGILGINIGKNRDTTTDHAIDDYVLGFQRVAEFASYVTINISSPNTPDLRSLQHGDLLSSLLKSLKAEQAKQKKYVPLVVKIAPDLTQEELENIAAILLAEKIDGVIATNTTIKRDGVENSCYANEAGGLSGKPLFSASTAIVRQLHVLLQNQIPIIACGGIFNAADAKEKLLAGASLIQIYTGLIYRGPTLISDIARSISVC